MRVHREACGAAGCPWVAGPSRDLARVQRLADQHRATAHRLDAAVLAVVDAPKVGRRPNQRRLRKQREAAVFARLRVVAEARWQRGEPGWVDRPRGSYGDRETRRERREARAARLVELSREPWVGR